MTYGRPNGSAKAAITVAVAGAVAAGLMAWSYSAGPSRTYAPVTANSQTTPIAATGNGQAKPDAASSQATTVAAGAPSAKPLSPQGAVAPAVTRYLDGVWTPLHFKPAIDTATNDQCLACHQSILDHKVRLSAPAGVKANDVLAWYQTLDTYAGDQSTFHARHLTTPLAKDVMNLNCNFCHQGHDPREESGDSSATTPIAAQGDFRMRKQVNPEKSCLMCHGSFPAASMGLEGSWHDLREGFESEEAPNGCLTCHAEQFRTVRHQTNYLHADAIEAMAKAGSSDLCFGCHGGRPWYRNSYPYPRHPWPGMPDEEPDWAKGRPKQSAPEHRIGTR